MKLPNVDVTGKLHNNDETLVEYQFNKLAKDNEQLRADINKLLDEPVFMELSLVKQENAELRSIIEEILAIHQKADEMLFGKDLNETILREAMSSVRQTLASTSARLEKINKGE